MVLTFTYLVDHNSTRALAHAWVMGLGALTGPYQMRCGNVLHPGPGIFEVEPPEIAKGVRFCERCAALVKKDRERALST